MIPPLLRYVEETASTNDDVMRLVMEGAPHGTAVYAGAQRQGRGRQGRAWHSPKDRNLALSVAVVGERFASSLPLLPLAVGVAMAELLEAEFDLPVQLKWPNDLLVDGKKLGGILCEGVQVGVRFVGAVAGVGVNVNLERGELPEDLRDRATSVRIEGGELASLGPLAATARLRIVEEAEALASGGRDALLARWQRRDVTRGREVEVLQSGEVGVAEGIERDGGLRVRMADGRLSVVRSGEVHLRPLPSPNSADKDKNPERS